MKAPLEKVIQKQILDYLKLKRIFCWKNSTVGIKKANGSFIPSGMTGISDILGLTKEGRFIAIEVKRTGNKTTPSQDIFMENIRKNGGIAVLAYSLDDVIDALEAKNR